VAKPKPAQKGCGKNGGTKCRLAPIGASRLRISASKRPRTSKCTASAWRLFPILLTKAIAWQSARPAETIRKSARCAFRQQFSWAAQIDFRNDRVWQAKKRHNDHKSLATGSSNGEPKENKENNDDDQ